MQGEVADGPLRLQEPTILRPVLRVEGDVQLLGGPALHLAPLPPQVVPEGAVGDQVGVVRRPAHDGRIGEEVQDAGQGAAGGAYAPQEGSRQEEEDEGRRPDEHPAVPELPRPELGLAARQPGDHPVRDQDPQAAQHQVDEGRDPWIGPQAPAHLHVATMGTPGPRRKTARQAPFPTSGHAPRRLIHTERAMRARSSRRVRVRTYRRS